MKKLSLISLMSLVCLSINAQSWAPNNASSISAVNQQHLPTPMAVGIGTTSPSAILHTVGALRFEGLSQNNSLVKVMVQDNIGNVSLRDASTIGSSTNNWSVNGNYNTNPNVNFLGTVDFSRLAFRTNNIEQATLLTNGNFGLGTSSPDTRLVVNSSQADSHIKVVGTAPSVQFGSWNARIGLSSQAGDFSQFSQIGDLSINNATNNIIISTGINSNSDGLERIRVNHNGYIGIATRIPTAGFHIDCTGRNLPTSSPSNVRFEHLPTGRGDRLLIDIDGYVFREAPLPSPQETTLDEIEQLKKELEILRSSIKEVKTIISEMGNTTFFASSKNNNALQIIPNPFLDKAKVIYSLEHTSDEALLQILNENGQLLKQFMLHEPAGELEINDLQDCGMIICNIVSKGKVLVSEKSIKIKY